MKYQRSPFLYLFVLALLLIALPILDYSVEEKLSIRFDVKPETQNEGSQKKDINERELITDVLIFSYPVEKVQ